MFTFNAIRKFVASAIVATVGLASAETCQAQVLGKTLPFETPRPNTPAPAPIQPPSNANIKNKVVVTVVTVLRNEQTGKLTTTHLDFTTHIQNSQTKLWEPQNWQPSYESVNARYKRDGWERTAWSVTNKRIVTGN